MIENFVFDMGNVITEYRPDDYVKAATGDPEKQRRLKRAVFGSPEWEMLDLGNITYPEAAEVWIKRDGDLSGEIRDICEHWHEHKTLIPPVNQFALAVKDKGFGVYLLSNASDKFPLYREKVPALRVLDGWIISYEHHILKPDPAIYELLFKTYALDPKSCFFIDDIAGNVEEGERLGMRGFVFPKDIPAQEAVKRLISAVSALGVNISYGELSRYKCERSF